MVALNVLGLNCGTSIDGIDIALCRITTLPDTADIDLELLSYEEVPVDPALRTRILALVRQDAATTLEDVCDLNFAIGEEFSRAILTSGVDLGSVDLIASHGQTLWHKPTGQRISTLQMGEPAVISHATKKTVTSGFRTAELAVGRQGAPLSGFFESAILAHPTVTRVSQNIGGIGNATVVPKLDGHSPSYFAFDTGPGNVLIDAAVRLLSQGKRHYDRDGEMGARGRSRIDHELLEQFLSNEAYFAASPPKTTGRELFSDDVAAELVRELTSRGADDDAIIATITRITAESIARAYESYVIPVTGKIDEVYLCGGGAFNPNIVDHIVTRLPHTKVGILNKDTMGISAEAKEAALFAVLGFLSVCGRPVAIPHLAESQEPKILGAITPGDNYGQLMAQIDLYRVGETLGRIHIKAK
ncbi:Anhydro-N-acetylmuramic acid kinase [Coniochaeta sp. 2T2.1]|nr:Anhydro-N-acetylmuramic acid kinase [Coniochaeta sp. 2T2.1]